MRGDSVRDLYAKAVALVGLGLLACAGAIVDYWPVPGDPPRVARAARVLSPQAAIPALAKKVDVPAAFASELVTTRQRLSAPAGTTSSPSGEVFLALAAVSSQPLGEPIELPAPPAGAHAAASEAAAEPRGDQPETAGSTLQREPKPAMSAPAVLQLASNPPADGVITGALKKTGESIVKTSAATGASIVDAFRGVFGAFKKVSPFSPNVGMPSER
jgi:hypothetical protein